MQDRGNASLPVDMVKILKTQDENYVRTMRAAGLKVRFVCCLFRIPPLYSWYRKLRNSGTVSRSSLTSSPMCTQKRTTTTPDLMKKNWRFSGKQASLRGRPKGDHHDFRRNTLYLLRTKRKVCMDGLYLARMPLYQS